MSSSNIPDMLNPYCYKIFALFHLQSPIMLWLRYCLKCPHNCRAKKDNCSEFYIMYNSNKDCEPKLTTWVESGLEKRFVEDPFNRIWRCYCLFRARRTSSNHQILTHSFGSNLKRQILC